MQGTRSCNETWGKRCLQTLKKTYMASTRRTRQKFREVAFQFRNAKFRFPQNEGGCETPPPPPPPPPSTPPSVVGLPRLGIHRLFLPVLRTFRCHQLLVARLRKNLLGQRCPLQIISPRFLWQENLRNTKKGIKI